MAERIVASMENWQRKLLDLSKRNRALNFRMNKVSTVAIVDEAPGEVFRQLYLAERTMKFRAVTPAEAGAQGQDEDAAEDAEPLPAPDFTPYDASALGDRQTDAWLQTASTPEALDKSLRRI